MPRKKMVEEAPAEQITPETAEEMTVEEFGVEPAEIVEVSVEEHEEETQTEESASVDGADTAEAVDASEPSATKTVRKRSTRKKESNPETEAPTAQEPVSQAQENEVSEAAPTETDARRAFFELDLREMDRELTPEGQQEWNSIYASYRGRNIMSGTVVGVDRHRIRIQDKETGEERWQKMYCAIVIPFRVRILIPETEMWMPGEERPAFVLRNIPGAAIDFVIVHVDREAGFAVGSRRLALALRRRYFAAHPHLFRRGNRLACSVLVVGPRRCLVSCHGYDLDMTQRELSYAAVPDLRDAYHEGQVLPCIVKEYNRETGALTVSVKETAPNPFDGAAFRHPPYSHRRAVISGKYAGGVFCNLPDGVTVLCSYSFHYDDAAFRIGDSVMLIIQRYDEEKKQIYGKIIAKC